MDRETLIRRIHAAPCRMVLAVTGGGSQAVADLLAVAGASRSVLAATIPYADKALDDWLGAPPESYCSSRTARAMAMAAFQTALRYRPEHEMIEDQKHEHENNVSSDSESHGGSSADVQQTLPLAGLACTASLASDRPKRGPHRVHAAVQTGAATIDCHLPLIKDARSRATEERLAADLLLNLAAEACELDDRLPLDLLHGEQLHTERTDAPEDWTDLLLGRVDAVCLSGDVPEGRGPTSGLIFPGAFNPLHEGHRRMAQVAERRVGRPVEYEISILNVDKPPLDYLEMNRRAAQLPDQALWFTRAARFEDKADIFPGTTFVVGTDTVIRIADPRYYDGSVEHRDQAIEHLGWRGCRLLVFGRAMQGTFRTLDELSLPDALRQICDAVPESEFHEDISSTDLRHGQHE